jgi:hypothetical protein
MKFLLSVGGVIDARFGILTSPGHSRGVPTGIEAGMEWAADNQAFTNAFRPEVYFEWLESMEGYKRTCLFITVPDKLCDAKETKRLFEIWKGELRGWPLAFVAQDGQEFEEFPEVMWWQVLFIGGSTEWKIGPGALECIKRAQELGKRIHIGRVNWKKRYEHFRQIKGSENFTCDGTRQKYEGIKKAMEAWAGYQEKTNVMQIW